MLYDVISGRVMSGDVSADRAILWSRTDRPARMLVDSATTASFASPTTIYADGPLSESMTLDDGLQWRNLVTPAKADVAQTLEDFRGNFVYNLLDENKRRFAT